MDPKNIATFWASNFIHELSLCGIKHAVISPGSRSTPLTVALATHPNIKSYVMVDERSAAFFALGIGRATGLPAVLVCTSGTAAANYLPAIVEARLSETPLLALTADRPPLHRFVGASQAIDQQRLFSNYPVFFFDAGEPQTGIEDLKRLRVLACQAFYAGTGKGSAGTGVRGPVHINFPFRKPLEPDAEFIKELREWYKKSTFKPAIQISSAKSIKSVFTINESVRPLILAGPHHSNADYGNLISKLANISNIPCLIEPGAIDASLKLKSFRSPTDAALRWLINNPDYHPDLIIRFGYQPVSRNAENLLASGIRQIHFFNGKTIQNTVSAEMTVVPDDPDNLEIVFEGKIDSSWSETFRKNLTSLSGKITDSVRSDNAFTDMHIHDTIASNFSGWDIMVSNSYPIRDLDEMLHDRKSRRIYVNRGASGIDGVTSTSAGIVAATGKKLILLTGDLAFIHDINALATSGDLPAQLNIFIINNQGGTIFRMLPTDQLGDLYTKYFETPQDVDFVALCKGYKIRCKTVSTVTDLITSIQNIPDTPGIHVTECLTDTAASQRLRNKIRKLNP